MKKAKPTAPVKVNNYHTNKPTRANGVPVQATKTVQVNNYFDSAPVVASQAPVVVNDKPRDVQKVTPAVNGKTAEDLVGKPVEPKMPMPPTDLGIEPVKTKKKNAKN